MRGGGPEIGVCRLRERGHNRGMKPETPRISKPVAFALLLVASFSPADGSPVGRSAGPSVSTAGAGATSLAGDVRSAAAALKEAIRDRDVGTFVDNVSIVLESNDRKAVRLALDAYTKLAKVLTKDADSWSDFYLLHRKTARAFGDVSGKTAIKEIERSRKSKRGDWYGRLVLLDAASFNKKLDIEDACKLALEDSAPQVVRRSLRYLRNTKSESTARKIVERFVEVEEQYGKKKDREWTRTLLAFQSTLMQLFGVDLPAALDWRNYVDARKGRKDFFEPPSKAGRGRTQVTLFGAAVTGKNIAFVLDISGSMMTTDPAKKESAKDGKRGRTVVGDPSRSPRVPPKPPEQRRRITRAKKEMVRVVNALPRDVRFNLISYSSDVYPWKDSGVQATGKNKKSAASYISELRAEGVTVTDMALEEAFGNLDVDTIYLVTDGAPTHVGTRGRGLPPDSAAIIGEIHERVKEINFLREVRIFTLGFQGAKEDFLQKLSKDHGGRYVAIE